MSNYNWCHNDKCHTYHTTDRIRGSKGNKVLRTRKIKVVEQMPYYYQGWENHFCRLVVHLIISKNTLIELIEIAPVREPSETPIEVKTEKVQEYRYKWNNDGDHERVPYISTKQKIIRND